MTLRTAGTFTRIGESELSALWQAGSFSDSSAETRLNGIETGSEIIGWTEAASTGVGDHEPLKLFDAAEVVGVQKRHADLELKWRVELVCGQTTQGG